MSIARAARFRPAIIAFHPRHARPEVEARPFTTMDEDHRITLVDCIRRYAPRPTAETATTEKGGFMRLSIRWRQLLAAPLAALALGAWISKEEAFRDLPLGRKVPNPLPIGKVHVPLPEGEWVVIGRNVGQTGATGGARTAGGTMGTLLLGDIVGGKLRGYTFISTTLEYPQGNKWAKPKDCSRTDTLLVRNEDLPQVYSFLCWTINHYSMRFSPTVSSVAEASRYFKDNGVAFPDTMLGARFIMSVGVKYLSVTYHWNPEFEGIAPSRNSDWAQNDWHKSRIHRFSDKAQYAEKTKAWADAWREKVKASFAQEP